MLLWRWTRWEWRIIAFCALAFGGAAAYAQLDEEFADIFARTRRDYHYPNALHLSCGITGPCDTVRWEAREATDRSADALMLDLPSGRITAHDLKDAQSLRARGWQARKSDFEITVRDNETGKASGFALPQDFGDASVVELESAPGLGSAQPYLRAKFRNGALETVTVRSDVPLSLVAQGRVYRLPVRRTRVADLWGLPLQLDRFNAVNGKLP
jgi:hypothetical protein